jgi:hypothetical protein
MKFLLVFDNSGDTIPFESTENEELFDFFVKQANISGTNNFTDANVVASECNRLLNNINWALSKTNEVLYSLISQNFIQSDDNLNYLDQHFLNRQHEQWVFSQNKNVDIDALRFSSNIEQARLGRILHDLYPDSIRKVRVAEAMTKLGYIYPYEEVNLTVHGLEHYFSNKIEFKSDQKWQVFDNPCLDTMVSNNNVVNFSFGYTYVGRQNYDKWKHFDTELEFKDFYNYESLEWAFQVNLARPETVPYSKEFLAWCQHKNVKPVTTQIPIGNIVDLEKNLHYYRTILYKNSRDNNRAKILI